MADTHQILGKYEFEDGGSAEFSAPLFVGSKNDCLEKSLEMHPIPPYQGKRPLRETVTVIVPVSG